MLHMAEYPTDIQRSPSPACKHIQLTSYAESWQPTMQGDIFATHPIVMMSSCKANVETDVAVCALSARGGDRDGFRGTSVTSMLKSAARDLVTFVNRDDHLRSTISVARLATTRINANGIKMFPR